MIVNTACKTDGSYYSTTKDDPLGEVTIPRSVVVRARESGTEQNFWLMLNNVSTGSVRSKVSWASLATSPARQKDDQASV